jgi:membrane associated rhomboid family serine protease
MIPLRDQLPTRTFPFVNYGLIGANIAAFLWERSVPEEAVERAVLFPGLLVTHPIAEAPTLVTHMFLHGSFVHIAGNMLFLWIFGDNVEDALGHARYVLFYFLCGLGAAMTQTLVDPLPMLGASGAIAGVLAAYLLLYPRSPIVVLNPIPLLWLFWGLFIYLPAWFVILEFFVLNLWGVLQPASPEGGGIAFAAHIGGFLTGLALLKPLRPTPVSYERWDRWADQRRARY